MKKRVYLYSACIFIGLVAVATPFHIQSTNQIVERQLDDDGIRGFFFMEDRLEDIKFQPREYIQVDKNGD
ncbi:hypothetical protein LGQ02_06745 [Bacillus shivajii]|uniref:hypothetical protein n=1 Tax=Bacillus shivajii TaxID=1983719 RepID=UPI001CFC1B6D|nr:hypothetical protein [Bacillus shivajii]UCZ54456.1 hypothetical protein LGQ02_06745 [Bacillus shivajii]